MSHILPVYARADISFTHGRGAYLYTEDGQRYLDFYSGIAVNALGHAHPRLVTALNEQGNKLWHLANIFQIPEGETLADRLCELSFADQVFFCNSGAEAWECGAKIMRKFHDGTKRWRMIVMQNCFHGRTLAGIAAAKRDKLTKGFGPLMDGFDQVPFGDIQAVKAAITDETAGICLEPIQGEGGLRPADPVYLKALRKLCDEHGILLFYDEIQCGMGRTGKLFAHEWSGAAPDIMCLAKALGGGFPIGACLASQRAADNMGIGSHGSTYGGNPLAMAVSNAVLDEITGDGFLDHVQKMAEILELKLHELTAKHDTLLEVRGMGLMRGIKLSDKVDNLSLLRRLRDHYHMITVGAGDNVLRLLPPLIIAEDHIDQAIASLDGALTDLG